VSEAVQNSRLNRRSLVLGAVFLVGGAVALTRFARAPDGRAAKGPAITADQLTLLEQVCDVIIPQTDTPGALAAGVPGFLRDMLAQWASERSRAEFIAVLEAIEKLAWTKFGASFLELPATRRLEVVKTFDEQALAQQDAAYGKFKYLVLVGYYQSEIGATLELRYELVPGAWRSCLPLSEVGRASAV
jgi:gluconate 2-dehydrogenase gamma chain